MTLKSLNNYPCYNTSLKQMRGEIWKDVKGYEGSYQVSSYGRLKSLPRTITIYYANRGTYVERPVLERILKQHIKKKYNQIAKDYRYECLVRLFDDFGERTYLVHRLVYEAFIRPLDFEKDHLSVSHKRGNGFNNAPSNLKAVTHSESLKKAYQRNRHISPFKLKSKIEMQKIWQKNSIGRQKPVIQYSLKDRKIKRYGSIKDASQATGIPHSNIIMVLKGRMRQAGGYKWTYTKKAQP